MGEPRRGTVIVIRRGDPEITEAIARGVLEGTTSYGPAGNHPIEGKALGGPAEERIEIVSAAADRRRVMALVRVAVGNTKTAEDYTMMTVKARGDYMRYARAPGPVRRIGRRIMAAYGMMVYGIARAYRAQDRVLGGRTR